MSSEEPASPRFMDVAVELSGSSSSKSKKDGSSSSKPTVKKLAKSTTSLRFIVQKLPAVMDGDTANHVTALLLDELDRLPVPGRLAKVTFSNLKLTPEAAQTWHGFLQSHATTVRHVALHNLLRKGKKSSKGGGGGDDDEYDDDNNNGDDGDQEDDGQSEERAKQTECLLQILQALEKAPLTVLDLSRNTLYGTTLWKACQATRSSSTLRQLILDSVDMNGESWTALATTFAWDGLDDLHVVLDQAPPTDAALEAACSIVRGCTKLSSLRWIQKRGPDRPLPWAGLRDMAAASAALRSPSSSRPNSESNMGSGNSVASQHSRSGGGGGGGTLKHVVLEGPGTPEFVQPPHLEDLAAALQNWPKLKTLKLRHLGLTDLTPLCMAIRSARPPLEVVDFSYNEVSSAGAQRLTDLKRMQPKRSSASPSSSSSPSASLNVLVLNDNRLETGVARELLEAYGSTVSLESNPGIDFSRIVTDLLNTQSKIERERDELRQQLEARAYESGGPNSEILQNENRRLREERDALVKAFSVMGVVQQVDEQRRLLERVQRLEDVVLLGNALKDGNVVVRGGGGGASGGGTGEETLGGKNASRRRINVNDLQLGLSAAAAAVASRNASARSVASNSNLSRSHSNRSTASRGGNSLGGNSVTGEDEVAPAVTESPHPTARLGLSSSMASSGNYHARTPPSPGQRSAVSPANLHQVVQPTPLTTGELGSYQTSGGDRRGLAPSLRHSSYQSPGGR